MVNGPRISWSSFAWNEGPSFLVAQDVELTYMKRFSDHVVIFCNLAKLILKLESMKGAIQSVGLKPEVFSDDSLIRSNAIYLQEAYHDSHPSEF